MPSTSDLPRSDPSQPIADAQFLCAPPRPAVRWCIVIGLAALPLFSSAGWGPRLFFIASLPLIAGTWRTSGLSNKRLWTRWTIAFIPLRPTTHRLRQFDFIEIVYQPPVGVWEFVLFGPIAFIWGWFADRWFPGIAGGYQLWLNNAIDERVLAWQGNNQLEFESLLEQLKIKTGLPGKTR